MERKRGTKEGRGKRSVKRIKEKEEEERKRKWKGEEYDALG